MATQGFVGKYGPQDARFRGVAAGLFLVMLVTVVDAVAQPPATVNVRGQLLDSSGDALTGNRAYTLRFFDAETDGTQLGSDLTGTVNVSSEGLFNVSELVKKWLVARKA